MIALEFDFPIAAPPEVVFAALCDLAAVPRWQAAIERVDVEPPGALRAGQRISEARRFLGMRMIMSAEVAEVVPNRSFAARSVPGAAQRFESRYTLAPDGDGTRLSFRIRMESDRLAFRILLPLLRVLSRRDAQARFDLLRRLLESGTFPFTETPPGSPAG